MEFKLDPLSIWSHLGTNGTYTVLGVSICSTNGERDGKEMVVVYQSHKTGQIFHRDINEFTDGRFRRIN